VRASEPQRTKYGSARWGTLEDIKKAGYWGGLETVEPEGRLLVSPGEDGEMVLIDEDDTIKHAIVVGPTGSGKTSSIFIPNLVSRCNKSAIVTEARAGRDKPDLYWKTARYRAIMGGQTIYHFDPDDLTSHRINPLDAVQTYDDARTLAQLIIDNTTGKNNYGDDVWPKSEVNMLTTLGLHEHQPRGLPVWCHSKFDNSPRSLVKPTGSSFDRQDRGEHGRISP
jgi:type IV secretory pathway TraG/TraD family ATPase VirD4